MKKAIILLGTIIPLLFMTTANAQRITVTLIGTGTPGYNGDNRPGYQTKVNSPIDICTDDEHNFYFTDYGRIRKLSNKGIITTIAGGGSSSADGVPATTASVHPNYMCIDANKNIFFTTGNQIKKIEASTGLIFTVAGSAAGYTGDGGPAAFATLNNPLGICMDAAGNIYVVDCDNSCIRKITAATGIINTVAGNGISGYGGDGSFATSAGLSQPRAIHATGSGDLFFTDQDGTRIRKVAASSGIITHFAGTGGGVSGEGGPASIAGIGNIYGVFVDDTGNVYINDESCSCRKISAATGNINRIAGDLFSEGYNGDGTNSLLTWFNRPYGLCLDETGNLYVAENYNNRIRKAIQLTTKPAFAYGKGQLINPCTGYTFPLDKQLSITDLDSAQSETWTIVSSPAHGSLSGFPHTTASLGANILTTPSGLSYTPGGAFTGTDSFKVSVSDGISSDTIFFTVAIAPAITSTTTGAAPVCTGASITLSESYPEGTWSASNSNASVTEAGIVNGVTAGIDTIIYTFSGSCTNAMYIPITIHESPNPGIIVGSDTLCMGTTITLSNSVGGGRWTSSVPYCASIDTFSGILNGLLTGNTHITYAVSNAWCTSYAIQMVAVMPLTNAGTISGPTNVCQGSMVPLFSTVPGGTWSSTSGHTAVSAGGTVTGLTAGADTIYYTINGFCGTASAMCLVNVDSPPSAGTITGSSSIIVGGTAMLSTTATTGGLWSSSNTAIAMVSSTGNVTGVAPGVATISYSVSNDCGMGVAHFDVTVVNNVGTNNLATSLGNITVAPNPTKSNFTINISAAVTEAATVEVSDVTGARVATFTGSTNQAIPASLNVAAGVYMLNITTAHGGASHKLVVE